MSGRYGGATHNLTYLQDLIKRDPESYREEFLEQYRHYEQILKVLALQPHQQTDIRPLIDVVTFLSQVAHKYPTEGIEFAKNLIEILSSQAPALDPEMRLSFCKALVLLRNRSIAPALETMQLFFELVKCDDKTLRKFLYTSLVSQIKRCHAAKHERQSLNQLQNFVFAKLKDSRAIVARTALLILIDSFRKDIWREPKTANAIAMCCFHKVTRIQVSCLKFLLGSEKEGDEESDDEEEKEENSRTMKDVMMGYRVGKKTSNRRKARDRAKKAIEKQHKQRKVKQRKDCNLIAIQYLFDAQDFAERLLSRLESKTAEKFEVRLLQMSLIARVIGIHKLQLLQFYPFIQRYCQPHQREVTRILLLAAQASHSLVPPDVVENLIRAIAQQFISDRNSSEAISVGLNAVREILNNCPFAANEELLRDLTAYKKYKNKNVTMAARSLIQLFRKINPKLLHRKDRGKPTEATKELEAPEFGRNKANPFVAGAECLPEETEEQPKSDEHESDNDSDDSDGWVDLPDSEPEEQEEEEATEEHGDEEMETEEQGEEPETKEDKAAAVSLGRILTQEEHRQINTHQLKKQIQSQRKNNKQTNDDIALEDLINERQESGMTRLRDIEHLHKKPRRETKAERKAAAAEGREDREAFGRKTKKHPMAGRTHKSVAKQKNFQMIKQKQRGKNRQRSFKDRQHALRKYLLKQKGAK